MTTLACPRVRTVQSPGLLAGLARDARRVGPAAGFEASSVPELVAAAVKAVLAALPERRGSQGTTPPHYGPTVTMGQRHAGRNVRMCLTRAMTGASLAELGAAEDPPIGAPGAFHAVRRGAELVELAARPGSRLNPDAVAPRAQRRACRNPAQW